ncbi:MAG TPA: hypothetical protein VGF55_18020, partial [Gemmataceae bacterium]
MKPSWRRSSVPNQALQAPRKGRQRGNPPLPPRTRLGLELLEDRTVFNVTSTLDPTTHVLNVQYTADHDHADISLVGSQVEVFDGTSPAVFSASQVQGISVLGSGNADQRLAFYSAVSLTRPLTAASLTQIVFDGTAAYTAASADLSAKTVTFGAGSSLTVLGDLRVAAADSRGGAFDQANAVISISSATLGGDNITLSADSALSVVTTGTFDLFSASLALVSAGSSAQVSVDGTSHLVAMNGLSISASSSALTSATATGSSANSAPDAAVANTSLSSSAVAHIGGTASISAGGAFSLAATNTTAATTVSDGTAGGGTATGGSVARTAVTSTTRAAIDGGASVNAGTIDVAATATTNAATTATSTSGGATQNSQDTQALLQGKAKTSDGNVSVAAAVALTNLTHQSEASILSTGTVQSGGGIAVTSTSSADSSSAADGSATVNPTGVGVAVAINDAGADSEAFLGGNATAGSGVTVRAVNPTTNTFMAQATSGAGVPDVGVAGALAINTVGGNTNRAQLRTGGTLAVGGDVIVDAEAGSTATASAKPGSGGGLPSRVGIGTSVAFNNVANTTAAGLEDDEAITGAHNVTVSATSNDQASTATQAGRAGGTAVAASVAVTLTDDGTSAQIGTGVALSTSGNLTVSASHTGMADAQAGADSAGTGVATGASLGITVSNDSTTADTKRDATAGGAVSITAQAGGTSSAGAAAGATGADPGAAGQKPTADQQIADQLAAAGSTAAPPPAQTQDGKVGVAAALAVNIASASSRVAVAAGQGVTAAGGFSLSAANNSNATATADGSQTAGATGVGAAVAINVATPVADAAIDGPVTAGAVTAGATLGGQTAATAHSGAGATDVGVAGAFALNVARGHAHAAVGPVGSVTVSSPAGDIVIQASGTTSDAATADGTVPGFPDVGVGASLAINIPGNSTTAEVNGAVTGSRDVTLLADGLYTSTTSARAGAAGGTATAPALAIAVTGNDTLSQVGTGAVVSAGRSLLVRAHHATGSATDARGDASASGVSVGAAAALNIVLDSAHALVAGEVSHSSTLAVEADLTGNSSSASTARSRGAQAGGPSPGSLIGSLVSFVTTSGWLPIAVVVPPPKAADGDVTVAAAVAVNIDQTEDQAAIAVGGDVTTDNPLDVRAISDVDASAFADGTTADNAITGVGAAVAINVAGPSSEASISGTAAAPAVTVHTEMGGDGTGTYSATAQSGAGATNTGVAGALAINVPGGSSVAAVRDGANLALTGGDLTVHSVSVTQNASRALGQTSPSDTVFGVGASVAVNVAGHESRAEIGAAAITGAGNVGVTATGNHAVTTTATAGAHLDNGAAAAAIAVAYSGNTTKADLLAGPSTLTLPGSVTVRAEHAGVDTTTADGKALPTQAGLGAAIGVGINHDAVTASLGRDVNAGGTVRVEADTTAPTTTTATASAAGGKSLALAVGEFIGQQIGLVDPNAGNADRVNVPLIGDTLTDVKNSIGLDLPVLGAAAAISANVALPRTLAEVAANTSVAAGGTVSVLSSSGGDLSGTADASAKDESGSAGLALAANFAGASTRAAVGDAVTITGAAIEVSAGAVGPQVMTAGAHAGAGGVFAGAAGSVALNLGGNTTQAHVGNGGHLTATSDVSITATGTLEVVTLAGGTASGLGVGVGASVAGTVMQGLTDASVGDSQVDAGQTISVLATAHRGLVTSAVAGTGAGLVALAGSITLTYLAPTTTASTGAGTLLDQTAPPSDAQSIIVRAEDDTAVLNGSGVVAGSLAASGSASVDAGVLKKTTQAVLGGTADAGGNVFVQAVSDEGVVSVSGTEGLSFVSSIAGSGGLYQLQVTTKAYVDGGADVRAAGSVVVSADDHSDVHTVAGIAAAAAASAGASAGLVLLDKDTEAYVDSGAHVTALGQLPPVTANNGSFAVNYVPDVAHIPGLVGSLVVGVLGFVFDNPVRQALESAFHLSGDLAFINVTPVSAPPEDPNLSMRRDVTPATQPIQGLAVTATSRDHVDTFAVGLGASFAATATFSAGSLITANQTRAYIGTNAVVNGDPTNAGPDQGVLVAAGSDTFYQAVTGAAAVTVGEIPHVGTVGAAVNLALLDNVTEAGIGPGAQVSAAGDIQVAALATQQILAFAAGLASGAGVSYANADGSIDFVSVHSATHAFIGAGAVVNAGGNVLVAARDGTGLDSIAGAAALGFGHAGVGLSFTTAVVGKDTQAYIGQGATVNAKANSAGSIAVPDGSVKPAIGTEMIHGVGVEARSSEDVFSVAGAGTASALIGASGAVTVAVLGVHTTAFVDGGARVNADQAGAAGVQTVNVSAADDAKLFGLPVNLSFGILTGGLGVDIGIVDDDTTARINAGAEVHAKHDIDVHALTRVEGDSFIANVGQPDVLGLNVSVSLYSLRGNFQDALTLPLSKLNGLLGTSLSDVSLLPLSKLNTVGAGTVQGTLDQAIAGFTQPGGGGVRDVIGNYSGSLPANGPIASALSTATPANVVSTALAGGNSGTGTTALVDGATLEAGGDVQVTAAERSDFAQDTATATDVLYAVAAPDPALASIYNDRAITSTRDIAVASVSGNAHVTAGHDVLVRGAAENDQTITATTGNNSVQNTVGALVDGSTVTAANDVNVQAHSDVFDTVWSVLPRFDGLQFKDGDNELGSTVEAKVVDGSRVAAGADVTVTATDDATAVVVGDSVTIGKKGALAGVIPAAGIALAINDTKDTVRAAVESSQVTATAGDVTVNATSTPVTVAVGLGIVQASQYAVVGGSIAFNTTQNVIDAHVSGTSTVTAAGSLAVTANDGGTTVAVGGNAAIADGFGAVGASFSVNTIANQVTASVDQAIVGAPTVEVLVDEDADVVAIAVGGANANSFALGGSIAINSLGNQLDARVSGGADLTATTLARVRAKDDGTITAITGEAAITTGFGSIGGAVSKNVIGDTLTAEVTGPLTAVSGPAVEVTAADGQTITTLSLGGAGANTAALGGSVSLNTIGSRVDAHAAAGASLTAGTTLLVQATDAPAIHALAGAGSGAGSFSVAGSFGTNTVADMVTASVQGATASAPGITVQADSGADILAIAGQGSGSGSVAATGAFSKNDIGNTVSASVGGTGTDVEASTVLVSAHDASSVQAIIGAGVGASTVALGGTITLNTVGGSVSAFVSGGTVGATSSVTLTARSEPTILSLAGAGSGSGTVAAGNAFGKNDLIVTTEAYVSGGTVAAPAINVSAATGADIKAAAAVGSGSGTVAATSAETLNHIRNVTRVRIFGSAAVTAAGALSVTAGDDSTIKALTGSGAGSGTVAGAAAIGTNDIANQVLAQIAEVTVNAAAVTLDAGSNADIQVLVLDGSGAGTVSGAASVALNSIANTVDADVSGGADVGASGAIQVTAHDDSNIFSSSLTGVGAGVVAVGAAWATNDIGTAVRSYVDGATVQTSGGAVQFSATEDATIKSFSAGGGGAGTVALTGAVSRNAIHGTVDAHASHSAAVTAAGDIGLAVDDASQVFAVTGQGGGALVGVGGVAAYNEIANQVEAFADGATLTSTGGSVNVAALDSAATTNIAVAGNGGLVGVAGSVSINLLNDSVAAYLTGGRVDAFANVTVQATYSGTLSTFTGGFSGGFVGVGGAVAVNQITNQTRAYAESVSVAAHGLGAPAPVTRWDPHTGAASTEGVRGLAVIASSTEQPTISTATLSGGFVGIGATVSVANVSDTTEAFLAASSVNSAADFGGAVIVRAHQDTDLGVLSGSLAGGYVGGGHTVDVAQISNATRAFISDSDESGNDPDAAPSAVYGRDVEVSATSKEHVGKVVIGIGGGLVGVAATVSVTGLSADTEAFVRDSDAFSLGGLRVQAEDAADIDAKVGSGAGGFVGVGGSVAVTTLDNVVRAQVLGGHLNATGALVVSADSNESLSALVGTAAGGVAAVAGNVVVSTVETTTEAFVGSGARAALINQDPRFQAGGAFAPGAGQTVQVEADDTARLDDRSGALAGGLAGVGASIDVSAVRNRAVASVGSGARISAAGDVSVLAGSDRGLSSFVLSVAGGFVGLNGSVAVASLGAPIDAAGAAQFNQPLRDRTNQDVGTDDVSPYLNYNDPQGTAGRAAAEVQAVGGSSVTGALDSAADTSNKVTAAFVASGDGPATGAAVTAGGNITLSSSNQYNLSMTTGQGTGGAVGIGAGIGIGHVHNTVQAFVGNYGRLQAGGAVTVHAQDQQKSGHSEVDAFGGTGGVVAASGIVGTLGVDTNTDAHVGGSAVVAGSAVTVEADQQSDARVSGINIVGGLVALGAVVPQASVTANVAAYVADGAAVGSPGQPAGSLTVKASAANAATASALMGSGGLVGGSAAVVGADVTPNVDAYVGAVTVNAGGAVAVAATSNSSADASATQLAGGLVAGGAAVTSADVGGSVQAYVSSGATMGAGSLSVSSVATDNASASGMALGAGLVAGNAAVTSATVNTGSEALIGTATITLTGAATVSASSADTASVTSGQVAVGAVAGGAAVADADVHGFTRAHVDGASITAGSLAVQANSTPSVSSSTRALAGGIGAGQGNFATATADPQVRAYLGTGTHVNAYRATPVSVPQGAGLPVSPPAGSLFRILAPSPNAGVYQFDGTQWHLISVGQGAVFADNLPAGSFFQLTSADGQYGPGVYQINHGAVTVTATATPQATATASGISAGALAVGVSSASTTVAPDAEAGIGSASSVVASSLTVGATEALPGSGVSASSSATGSVGGLVGLNATITSATAAGTVKGYVGDGSVIVVDGATSVSATNNTHQSASSSNAAGGLVAGGAAVAGAKSVTTTQAFLGTNVHLTGGSLNVSASGNDQNNAFTTAGSGGVVAGAATAPSVHSTANVLAKVGDGDVVDLTRGGTGGLTVAALHVAAGGTGVQTTAIGALSGAGAVAKDTVDSTVQAVIGDGATVTALSSNVTATNRTDLADNTQGTTGGLVSGAGATSDVTLNLTTLVTVGTSAHVEVVGATSNNAVMAFKALNIVNATNKVSFT